MSEVKLCSGCSATKPVTEFSTRRRNGVRVYTMCRPCLRERLRVWEAKNPEAKKRRQKAYGERKTARYRAMAHMGHDSGRVLDAAMRSLVDHPLEFTTDEERVAYFRGFLAGANRREVEDSRFAEYQDLVPRIAGEIHRKHSNFDLHLSFEDMVSVGYEAVLEVLRKKTHATRNDVAGAIRNRIKDAAREKFGRTGRKNASKIRHIARATGIDHQGEDDLAPVDWLESSSAEDVGELVACVRERVAAGGVDPRMAEVIELRLTGHTYAEVGAKLGISECRAWQIVNEAMPWLEREVLPLAV